MQKINNSNSLRTSRVFECCISKLEEETKREFNRLRDNAGSNLTNRWKSDLNYIINSKRFQTPLLDKNTGPVVVSR